jgi:hypothetical protein
MSVVHVDAIKFSSDWVRAWNAHDVEAVLAHFDDQVVFSSPVALELFPETGGVVRGKVALRAYWIAALTRVPELKFTVESVYQGIETIVINYRNQTGGSVNEVLRFTKENLVIEGHGTYLAPKD